MRTSPIWCVCSAVLLLAACASNSRKTLPSDGTTCRGAAVDAYTSNEALCVVSFATDLASPRGLAFAPNGDLFVVGAGTISILFDADGDGVSGSSERAVFATAPGLNHGLAFGTDGAHVYASNSTTVFRWPYTAGQRTAAGDPETVVTGISEGGHAGGGGHATRTLAFDTGGTLFVTVGSAGNVDTDPTDLAQRSQIRKFAIPAGLSEPLTFLSGEIVATGLRNEVGIAFDANGRLWGVENSRDQLVDDRFGGDIHTDNPAEEINRLDGPGSTFFGYPQCWPEGILEGGSGPGTHHADLSLPESIQQSEAWCNNSVNVRRSARALPAHWAPLGITAYRGTLLPESLRSGLFITAHGSWNRESDQVGRLVAHVPIEKNGTLGEATPLVGQADSDGELVQGRWDARPADIKEGPDGALYFSDDAGGRLFRIGVREP